MTSKFIIAAMLIIASLNLVAFYQDGSIISLIIAIFLMALSVIFTLKMRRQQ